MNGVTVENLLDANNVPRPATIKATKGKTTLFQREEKGQTVFQENANTKTDRDRHSSSDARSHPRGGGPKPRRPVQLDPPFPAP